MENSSNKPPKPRNKSRYQKPKEEICYYCGGKEFERFHAGHVGVIKVCKNCREEQ